MADHKDEKEKMAFCELKKRMEGDMEDEMYKDDNLFHRFLKARDYNVDNAEKMLRQHLEWREKNDVKNISEYKPPEVLEKYLSLYTLGYDKEGRIVKYSNYGNTDYRGIFESITMEEWNKSLIRLFENDMKDLKKQSEKLGKTVDKLVFITNMENFSLAKATDKKVMTYMIASNNVYLNNYPETLKTSYIINAPVYINIFFAIMKPFLPSAVIEKIKIYSDDSWKNDFAEMMDAEVLPAFLGGKKTDPDGNPQCVSIIKNPGPVPKHYYLSENKRKFSSLPDVQKVNVPKGSTHELQLEVKEPGSHLEWEFHLKSGDIKFGIFYQNDKEEKTEIIPLHRSSTDEHTESGLYRCENTGTYIAVFDNSYSFLRSKDIYYKINVNDPGEESSPLNILAN